MRNVYLFAALMLGVQICGAGAEQLKAPHIFIAPDRRGNCFGILELERLIAAHAQQPYFQPPTATELFNLRS
jgi:hypothetical protein